MPHMRPIVIYQDKTLEALQNFRIRREWLTMTSDEDVGRGGFGVVKTAVFDRRDGSEAGTVAVKLLRTSLTESEVWKGAFRLARELVVWGRLVHQNILPLIGFHLSEDLEAAWLISPYLENGNVAQYLQKNRPDMTERLRLASDTAEGLGYLHGLQPPVLHADLKAYNVLVNEYRRAMLCDFGLSRAMSDDPTGLTTTKGFKGTLRYFSPELVNDDEPASTLHSDMWAWGCLALEILTGLKPYRDCKTEVRVALKISQGEKPADLKSAGLPHSLLVIVHACWAKTPTLRPPIRECLGMLSKIDTSELSLVPAPATTPIPIKKVARRKSPALLSPVPSSPMIASSPSPTAPRPSSPHIDSHPDDHITTSVYRSPYSSMKAEPGHTTRARTPLKPILKRSSGKSSSRPKPARQRAQTQLAPPPLKILPWDVDSEVSSPSSPESLSALPQTPNDNCFPSPTSYLPQIAVSGDGTRRRPSVESGAIDTETESEGCDSSNQSQSSSPYSFPSISKSGAVLALDETMTSQVPARSAIGCNGYSPDGYEQRFVFLEKLALPGTKPPTLRGSVLVRNIAFQKGVIVRFTLDDWETTNDAICSYNTSLPTLPLPLSSSPLDHPSPNGDNDTWDRFAFTLKLGDMEDRLAQKKLRLAVSYRAPGQWGWGSELEWWDNNDGMDYVVAFKVNRRTPNAYTRGGGEIDSMGHSGLLAAPIRA